MPMMVFWFSREIAYFPKYNASDYDEVFCERHEPSEKCKYAFSFVNLKRK